MGRYGSDTEVERSSSGAKWQGTGVAVFESGRGPELAWTRAAGGHISSTGHFTEQHMMGLPMYP